MPTRADYLELQHRALRHAMAVERFGAGLASRQGLALRRALQGRLTDRVAGAVARVRARGPTVGPHSRKGLRDGLRAFDLGLHETLARIRSDTTRELRELAEEEGDHETRLLVALFGGGAGVAAASRGALRRPVLADAFAGARLRDHFRAFERNVREGVRREVVAGLSASEPEGTLLQRIFGTTRSAGLFDRAERAVVRRLKTLATGAAAAAREEVHKKSDGVRRVVWLATLDGNTCPRCAALHGRRFRVGEGPRPPLHLGCRCMTTPAPVTRSDADVVAIDFDSWLRAQPEATQKDVLGATRARLFRDRKVELRRFTTDNHRLLTLDELRARGVEIDPFPNTPIVFR